MDYTARNIREFNVKAEKYIQSEAKRHLIDMLREVAQRMVGMIDNSFGSFNPPTVPYAGDAQFPVWYGQMHDSTGVGIYDYSVLISYLPTKRALDSQPQTYKKYTGIIGSAWLQQALAAGKTTFNDGLYLVLFSAVPYAYKINTQGSSWGRGPGYFDRFSDSLLSEVLAGLKAVKL